MKLGGKKLPAAVTATDIRPWPKRSGKVRDIYDLGDRLLIVATDRISAFDLVLKPGFRARGGYSRD
jgi:phosphoribosylaminoimidazole-succinocarboxamide synthase